MQEKYRGDTFIFPFSFADPELKFEIGDTLKFGMKKACDCETYILYKEIVVEEQKAEVEVRFEAEETAKIEPGDYFVELELKKDNIVETCYREKIKINGDIVNGNSS